MNRPVIPGFHPDPSICRVGSDFFLATSSFEYFPGIPIFHSTNLSCWVQIGNALAYSHQIQLSSIQHSGGVYAPTLRHHNDRFWLTTTNVSDPPGQLILNALDAAGPWSEPTRIPNAHGIDPDLFWDRDGTCFLTWSGESPDGQQGIFQAQLNPDSGQLKSDPEVVWRGTGGQYPEGPHVYSHGDWFYLLIAEGGTERGHCVTIGRSKTPFGPFEPCPGNPILTACGSASPVQNTGHADLIQCEDETWAMVYLGVRPRGATPGWHVLGRETFVTSIEWLDDWPKVLQPIEPEGDVPMYEVLDGPDLPLSWVTPSTELASVFKFDTDQWKLLGTPETPVFVGRRQEQFNICVQACIEPGIGEGGLELRIDPFHRLVISVENGIVQVIAYIKGIRSVIGKVHNPCSTIVELHTEASSDLGFDSGPDVIVAGVREVDGYHELARWDGRYLSTEVAGGFTGRFVGFYSERSLVIRSFSYRGCDAPLLTDEEG